MKRLETLTSKIWNEVYKAQRYYSSYDLSDEEKESMFKVYIKEYMPNNVIKALWIIENLKGNFALKYNDDTYITTFYFDEKLTDTEVILFKLSCG